MDTSLSIYHPNGPALTHDVNLQKLCSTKKSDFLQKLNSHLFNLVKPQRTFRVGEPCIDCFSTITTFVWVSRKAPLPIPNEGFGIGLQLRIRYSADFLNSDYFVCFGLRDVYRLFLLQLMAEGTLSQMEAVGNPGRTTKKIIDYYPVNHCAV